MYYQSLADSFTAARQHTPLPAEQEAQFRSELEGIVDRAMALTVDVNSVYRKMSVYLNPSSRLFSFSQPTTHRSERGASLPILLIIGILTLTATVPLLFFLCLAYDKIAEHRRRGLEIRPLVNGQASHENA
jgi:hypothetical protein